MKIKTIITIIFLLTVKFTFANLQDYNCKLIPDSLKKNADAVIRNNTITLTITDDNKYELKEKKVITILNNNGSKHAVFMEYYDKFSKISGIHYTVYDKNGKVFDNAKNSEIKDYSDFSSYTFFSDNRFKYISKPAIKPPYTIEYEYITRHEGYLSLPGWMPSNGYNVSVIKSSFKIVLNNSEIKIKEINVNNNKINYLGSQAGYYWEVKNLKAIKKEQYSSNIDNYFTIVKPAPKNFELAGYKGNTNSWKDFGLWLTKLNKKRDTLDAETIQKIIELTKHTQDPKEKAKIIYEYMQNKTRYLSIQLGIGGWQPFSAMEVDRDGYGDCKALSNYTMALLKAVGIKSKYTIVQAGNKFNPITTEFPSNQFNHAILCLPFENDTIWLECTSQTAPFGYLGNFTDNRNVLLIDENGGKLVKTKSYPDSVNFIKKESHFVIAENGGITGTSNTNYSGLKYDEISYYLHQNETNQKKYLQKRINIPSIKIDSFSYVNKKGIIPIASEKISLNTPIYATISSSRLFVPVSFTNDISKTPEKNDSRKTTLFFRNSYTTTNYVEYNIPKGYVPEYIPKNIERKTEFGYFTQIIAYDKGILKIKNTFKQEKGEFPASSYNSYRTFIKRTDQNYKDFAVFIKKEN